MLLLLLLLLRPSHAWHRRLVRLIAVAATDAAIVTVALESTAAVTMVSVRSSYYQSINKSINQLASCLIYAPKWASANFVDS